jgi:hypothetical protein
LSFHQHHSATKKNEGAVSCPSYIAVRAALGFEPGLPDVESSMGNNWWTGAGEALYNELEMKLVG